MLQPRISVIIPLYNKAPYIERTVESVLKQTFTNFEIIVVNDGSTDGSENIVKGYIDPRIILINQQNQGVSTARNNGVAVAKTNLVAFLDADDEWMPDFLEKMLELRSNYPDAIMYTCSSLDSSSKSIIGYKESDTGIINNYFRYCALNGHPINCSSVLVDKKTFQEIGGFNAEFKFYEDCDLWDRLAYVGNIAYINLPLTIYHTESSLDVDRIEKCRNKFKLPFLDYLKTISIDDLKSRLDYPDILLYLDSLKILSAKITAYHDKSEAISIVKSIHSKELRIKKYKILIYSIIPNNLKKSVIQIYNRLLTN